MSPVETARTAYAQLASYAADHLLYPALGDVSTCDICLWATARTDAASIDYDLAVAEWFSGREPRWAARTEVAW